MELMQVRTSSRWLLLAIVLGAGGLASADDAAVTSAAPAHYDAGRTYFQAGDLRRAIVEFRAAQRDDDRPPLDYNLGICFERLGDAARAVDAFRRFLARQAEVPERASLEARIAALEKRVGALTLVSRTPDTRFTVDDETVLVPDDGSLRLTAGRHHIVASKDGYSSHALDVTVVAGARVDAELTLVSPAEIAKRRRRTLAIALGTTGAIIAAGIAVGLGVYFGDKAQPHPYQGNVPAIVVNP